MSLPSTHRLRDGRSVVVRHARPEDAEAHIANFNAIAAERIYVMTETFPRTVEEIRTQFRDAGPRSSLWLVAEADGRVIGGANLLRGRWEKNGHTAELGVAILAPYRGIGLGELLLRACLEWAREVGIRKVRLGVFASNERAIALYRKVGFREEGRLRREVVLDGRPVDEVLMALWLDGSDGP
jgi:RimJ/RimL family protein N-acetyltransferase